MELNNYRMLNFDSFSTENIFLGNLCVATSSLKVMTVAIGWTMMVNATSCSATVHNQDLSIQALQHTEYMFTKSSSNIVASPDICDFDKMEWASEHRLDALIESFRNHAGLHITSSLQKEVCDVCAKLSDLPFHSSLAQYDEDENLVDFALAFDDGLEISVVKYLSIGTTHILYTIFHGGEMLLSHEMPLESFIGRVKKVLAEI